MAFGRSERTEMSTEVLRYGSEKNIEVHKTLMIMTDFPDLEVRGSEVAGVILEAPPGK